MAEPESGQAEFHRTTPGPQSTTPALDGMPDGGGDSATATDFPSANAKTPGHPEAQGTLPMARILTDPAVEEWVQHTAASAPPMTEDQRARLSRLLRLNRARTNRPAP